MATAPTREKGSMVWHRASRAFTEITAHAAVEGSSRRQFFERGITDVKRSIPPMMTEQRETRLVSA